MDNILNKAKDAAPGRDDSSSSNNNSDRRDSRRRDDNEGSRDSRDSRRPPPRDNDSRRPYRRDSNAPYDRPPRRDHQNRGNYGDRDNSPRRGGYSSRGYSSASSSRPQNNRSGDDNYRPNYDASNSSHVGEFSRNGGRSGREASSGRREHRSAQGSGGGADYSAAKEHAERDVGAESSALFAGALSLLVGKEKELGQEPVDEGAFTQSHRQLYHGDDADEEKTKRNVQSLGQAAAIEALRKFTGSSGGEKDQNAFIGLAMAEAVKLFDAQQEKGNIAPEGNKQDVINTTAQIALKLFLRSKLDASSSGSGEGGLVEMASKFLM